MSAVGDARKRAQEKASTPDDRESLENEALENALVEYDEDGRIFGTSGAGAFFLADHLLKSDWLAEHDAKVRREALREMGDIFRTNAAASWGGESTWLTTGTRVGSLAAGWCDDRAARIARQSVEGGGEDA